MSIAHPGPKALPVERLQTGKSLKSKNYQRKKQTPITRVKRRALIAPEVRNCLQRRKTRS